VTLQINKLRWFKVRAGPSGVHLFDRVSGANILLDEARTPSQSWSLAPRYVSVALTNACELSCPYCYAPKKPAALDFEQLAGWLIELDENGCLGIGFGGGEPTLYRGFVELCRFASQETSLAVSFTTHGHNLDERLLAELNGNVHFMRVSMDGVGATYERLRGRSFHSFLQHLKLARRLAPFGVNYVVNSQTLPDLDRATKLATDLGAAEFLLLPEQPVHGMGGVDSVTMSNLRLWVSEYQGRVPLAISEAWTGGLDVANPLFQESGLRGYAHIDARGTLKRSSYDCHGQAIGVNGVMKALELYRGDRTE
jgi:MoaA/NifB/PqqE/SkfB family radical SAM enzyme